ncbi:MAG: arylsulfatase A-like enzyme [Arcticibacterium sp.]|jgi:arylsulfatase A-like enzyme
MKKVFLLLALPLAFFSCQTEKAIKKPNVIFIMTDDHAKKAMSAYEGSVMQTPHLDQLAAEGVLFDRAYCTNSICGPSRAVVLTGKHSHKNGFMSNHDTFDGDQASLAKYMQSAGYHTSLIGKWHLVSKPQGFDDYKILLGQGEYYNPRFVSSEGDTTKTDGYTTNLITDMALDVIGKQKAADKPFFMMLHHKAPHRNWMPDSSYLQAYEEKHFELPATFFDTYAGREGAKGQDMRVDDMFWSGDMKLPIYEKKDDPGTGGFASANQAGNWERAYNDLTPDQKAAWDDYYVPIIEEFYKTKPEGKELAQWMYNRYMNDYTKTVQSVDDNIGRLMTYLKAEGLDENTLIIYTSDQGFYLGEHGWYDKRYMYEPSFGMPFLVRYPDGIKAGQTSSELVQNLDVAPTILDFVGEPIPEDMQGTSLKTLLTNSEDVDWQKSIYYHYYQGTGWHHVPRHNGVATDRFKLMHFYDIDDWELFDLETDPEEMNNLYGKAGYEEKTAELKTELKRLIVKYDDDTAVEI